MIYQSTITISPNTFKASPLVTDLFVTKGLVYFIEVFIPPGVSGLAGLRVFDASHQVWPSTEEEWFVGDDLLLNYSDLYLKEEAPFVFRVEACNEDETYEHTLTFRIGMVSKRAYQARFLPTLEMEMYEETLNRIRQEQEEEAKRQKSEIFKSSFLFGSAKEET